MEVIQAVKMTHTDIEPIVIEADSCKRVEFSWHGNTEDVLAEATQLVDGTTNKRGRPKLGVKSKEVTLLPRHWEWLSTQKGSASATLRRLVEDAQSNNSIEDNISLKQQQLDQFMLLFLGDEAGFEAASRSLYRNSRVSFESAIATWPDDIKAFVMNKFVEIMELHNG